MEKIQIKQSLSYQQEPPFPLQNTNLIDYHPQTSCFIFFSHKWTLGTGRVKYSRIHKVKSRPPWKQWGFQHQPFPPNPSPVPFSSCWWQLWRAHTSALIQSSDGEGHCCHVALWERKTPSVNLHCLYDLEYSNNNNNNSSQPACCCAGFKSKSS